MIIVCIKNCTIPIENVRFEEQDLFSAIYFLLQKYKEHQTCVDLRHNAVPRKIINEMLAVTDVALLENDELTARQLRNILKHQYPDLVVLLSTVKNTHIKRVAPDHNTANLFERHLHVHT